MAVIGPMPGMVVSSRQPGRSDSRLTARSPISLRGRIGATEAFDVW